MLLKKRWPMVLLLVAAMIFVVLAQGCGSAKKSDGNSPEAKADKPKVTMLKIMGGATGGLYQVYATTWGKILEKNIPGLQVQVESSGGAISNHVATNDSLYVLGLSTNAISYEALNGISWTKGKTYTNVRALFPVYPSISHFFASSKTGIKTINDLNGKVVSLGPAGGGMDVLGRQIFEVLGIKPRQMVNQSFADMVQGMGDGMVDVGTVAAGHPNASIMELEKGMQLNHIEISDADRKKVTDKYPYYPVVPLAANTYKGQDHVLNNLTVYTFAVANKDLPDDMAYTITKLVLENNKDLVAAVQAAVDTKAENIKYVNLLLHPGALKYYREIGVQVPAEIIPPGAK
ncbi:MAG: TAXI family TRAP transporter solute-binding subunit [Desulfocucumaceae bacterium]